MYVIRDIFYLKFGHYRDVKALLDEANKKGLLPNAQSLRVLSDFTGDSYRVILEEGHKTLNDYEQSLQTELGASDWKEWYEQFKPHVERSYREILKQIL